MINQQELPSKINLGLIDKKTLPFLDEWAIAPTLNFEPKILAYDKWQEILEATQKDGLERSLTIALDGDKLITGEISKGTKNSSSLDLLPRGIRSVFSRKEINLVSVHTHPMTKELDHIQTVPISDKDINTFINSTFKAMLTIDRGGVHMLTRNRYFEYSNSNEEQIYKITEESLKIAKDKDNTAIAVMKEIGKKLNYLGIKYYYSPNLTLTPDGFIELIEISK